MESWSESADIGLLRLELPREIYERAGLMGKPIRDGGRKHMKTRYGMHNQCHASQGILYRVCPRSRAEAEII